MYLWSPKTHKVRYQMTSVSQFFELIQFFELKAEKERFSLFFK